MGNPQVSLHQVAENDRIVLAEEVVGDPAGGPLLEVGKVNLPRADVAVVLPHHATGMDARPELEDINRLTLRESLNSLPLKLWDESEERLVSFRQL